MNKILIAFLLTTPFYQAFGLTPFGRVVDIKGSGFLSQEGKTHEIKKGEVIYAGSEIVVENAGQVVFTDSDDHRYFLGSASSAAATEHTVELRNGNLWLQSTNGSAGDWRLTSANSSVNFQAGEAIFSYDSMKGRTQLMVISGLMKFSNLMAPELNLTVGEGNFSFIDLAFEEGMPRDPTPVGEKTYKKLVSLFSGVTPLEERVASVFKDAGAEKKVEAPRPSDFPVAMEKGESTHESAHPVKPSAHRSIASVNHPEIHEKNTVAKTPRVSKKSSHGAREQKLAVKIYGLESSGTSVTTAIYDIPAKENKRAPASVPDMVIDQAVPGAPDVGTPDKQQLKEHNKESEKLIEELERL